MLFLLRMTPAPVPSPASDAAVQNGGDDTDAAPLVRHSREGGNACLQTSAFTVASAFAGRGVKRYTASVAPDASDETLRIKPKPRHAGKKNASSFSFSFSEVSPRRFLFRRRDTGIDFAQTHDGAHYGVWRRRRKRERAGPVVHEHENIRDAHSPRL
jgi:hypothetical protein